MAATDRTPRHPGNGGSTEPMTGMSYLLGYSDGPPMNSGVMYPDPVAGVMGYAAVLIALHHKQRTGRGQLIDLSQQETLIAFLGDKVVEYTLGGRAPEREANRDPWMAPHGNYRCRGDDSWIAIAVRLDSEWTELCRVAGHLEWASDPRFSDAAGRRHHLDKVNGLVESWTEAEDADEIMRRLQKAGVPAARVLNAEGVLNNPQLEARGFFERVDPSGLRPTPTRRHGLQAIEDTRPGPVWRRRAWASTASSSCASTSA